VGEGRGNEENDEAESPIDDEELERDGGGEFATQAERGRKGDVVWRRNGRKGGKKGRLRRRDRRGRVGLSGGTSIALLKLLQGSTVNVQT
jgi:hypothetical protein